MIPWSGVSSDPLGVVYTPAMKHSSKPGVES
jgi:hypothetical protein